MNCPICHSESEKNLSSKLRRGEGAVLYCEACEHGFLATDDKLDAKKYYDEEYRQEYSHRSEAAKTDAKEIFETYKDYQRDRLRLITPYLSAETELLEVGSSSGQFLVNIAEKVAKLNAIELDKACCSFVENELGIPCDSEFLRESLFADNVYDIVCSFQVMEHVPDPVEFLKDLRQSTKPGGHIFVEVPNLRDPLLSIWDVDYYKTFFYHSAHLSYFTEASLMKTAELAGFSTDEVQITFTQDYNLLNHLSWVMNGTPQETCHIGLSEISLKGKGDIPNWLEQQLRNLGQEYESRLVAAKSTSNIMMMLKNV